MIETSDVGLVARRLALAVVVSLVGLVGLPLVFGGVPDPTRAIVWLGLAVADTAALLPATLRVADPLTGLLLRVPAQGVSVPSARRAAVAVARLAVVIVYGVLLQAILRRPLVAVFGATAEPFAIEAGIAIAIMLLVLMLLAWLHAAAGPLIEGMAHSALDAALATTSPDAVGRPVGISAEPESPTVATPLQHTPQIARRR